MAKDKIFQKPENFVMKSSKRKRRKISFLQKCITSTRDIVCDGSAKKLCKPLIFHTFDLNLLDKKGWNKLGNSM